MPELPTYQDDRYVWPATIGWVLDRRRRGLLHRLMIWASATHERRRKRRHRHEWVRIPHRAYEADLAGEFPNRLPHVNYYCRCGTWMDAFFPDGASERVR